MTDLRPELAEAVGVFFIVLAGGASILTSASSLAIALAFGFAVAVLIYALGHVCGAHFNPAITLAFAVTGHFPWRRVPTYVLAQCAGATLASVLLLIAFPSVAPVTTHPHIGLAASLLIELLATALLALVIIGVATDERAAQGFAGLAIGFTVAVGSIAFGPLTGASMNPARSLGPALASGAYADLWLYLVAPFIGAALGMMLYEFLRRGRTPRTTLGALGRLDLDQEIA